MMRLLRQTLTFILWLFSGLTKPFFNDAAAVVLCYHSLDRTGWKYGVDPAMFVRQMEYLQKKRRPVALENVIRFLAGKINLPEGAVAVTFDDGYLNVIEHGLDVLRRLKIPAVFFVTADRVSGSRELGNDFPLANWDNLLDAARAGIEIGSHSRTHAKLDLLPPDEIAREAVESKAIIESEIGKPARFFSYPKGRFTAEVIEAVRAAGYEAACGMKQGLVQAGDDRFRLKRVEIRRDMPFWEFKARLTRAAGWLAWFWLKVERFRAA